MGKKLRGDVELAAITELQSCKECEIKHHPRSHGKKEKEKETREREEKVKAIPISLKEPEEGSSSRRGMRSQKAAPRRFLI